MLSILTSYSWDSLRLSLAFSSSVCSASSLMGMGGWLIIPVWQQGVKKPRLGVVQRHQDNIPKHHRSTSLICKDVAKDNYTIGGHHISLRKTLRQKINFDACARAK